MRKRKGKEEGRKIICNMCWQTPEKYVSHFPRFQMQSVFERSEWFFNKSQSLNLSSEREGGRMEENIHGGMFLSERAGMYR